MKNCIWCLKSENETLFLKIAHTIPQSLGGKNVCENVCDQCNSFFGNYYQTLPAVETVIKETFNITRARLLSALGHLGKNKTLPRFKSIYFNVDFNKGKLDLKSSYKFTPGFQEKIARQLKKGLYKIFLEESERQNKNGHEGKFDFIRDFCLRDQGDYPVFYFERRFGAIMVSESWIKNPQLFFDGTFKYLISTKSFFEFELLGHVLGIAINKDWEKDKDKYLQETAISKHELFQQIKNVTRFNDIDLTLSVIDK